MKIELGESAGGRYFAQYEPHTGAGQHPKKPRWFARSSHRRGLGGLGPPTSSPPDPVHAIRGHGDAEGGAGGARTHDLTD